MTKREALLDLMYFWQLNKNLEQWALFDKYIHEFPEVMNAWLAYKAVVANMDDTLNNQSCY